MGEEDKKPEKAKAEEEKEEKVKDDAPKAEKEGGDEKKEEKKSDEPKAAAPPPPQEIVLKVYMHCEGCARKVRRCLKGFEGVEDVTTDCRTGKVVVKGEKADPLKVLERVQRKSHRAVALISPIPKPPPPPEEPKKPEEKPEVKAEEKKELPAITAVLGVYMHCEACAQEIRKRIQRMKGVESAEPDLKSSQVTVKGAFEPEKLTDYLHKRTGKHVVIVKVEPLEKKDGAVEEGKKDAKEEKPAPEAEKEPKKSEDNSSSSSGSKEKSKESADSGGGEQPEKTEEAEESILELKKNEFAMYQYHQFPPNYQYAQQNYYVQFPQRPIQELYAYPPQIFSDENPNACHVM